MASSGFPATRQYFHSATRHGLWAGHGGLIPIAPVLGGRFLNRFYQEFTFFSHKAFSFESLDPETTIKADGTKLPTQEVGLPASGLAWWCAAGAKAEAA